ncbi:triacylglycerol lipase [Noviherbaspirillum sp. UKPF54]|uniref:lipase family alpha/beta hydrolase n=1 Tax=Noviherbaspirillum sp. UKPF54 TaxID=2601898 RepID=UPI0011B15E6A|nr:triacylglycerol lipase [Noviherbaspirillum sp. UKPF54]QDZ29014.1 triacylglycerol lipase [Noviherbaspirillum sp. UKPF54]
MKKQLWSWLIAVALALGVLSAPAYAGYTQTRYPIVLVHGLLGFDSIGPLDYWYGIPSALRDGGAQVYVAQVAAANSTEVRGEQLLTQVQQILAITGASKVNLIGHSHGGPTTRYVASVRPDLIASVTTIGGVNKGSKVADAYFGLLGTGTISSTLLNSIVGGTGQLIDFLSGGSGLSQNGAAAIWAQTSTDLARFNALHPEGVPSTACGEGAYQARGVYYFSWSGAQPYTNVFDILDPALALTSLAFGGEKNDGLVGSCSTHLGRVIRDDYGMNHLDEVNQTIGIVNIFETNPVTLFRQHANRLQGLGL